MFSGGIEREQWHEITEAAAQRCYLQNLLLKILPKSPENTCEKTFSTKVAGQPATLLNKLPMQVFSRKFSEILKNSSYRTSTSDCFLKKTSEMLSNYD